jgi:hypothetical protein
MEAKNGCTYWKASCGSNLPAQRPHLFSNASSNRPLRSARVMRHLLRGQITNSRVIPSSEIAPSAREESSTSDTARPRLRLSVRTVAQASERFSDPASDHPVLVVPLKVAQRLPIGGNRRH